MSKLTLLVELIGETAHRAPGLVPADEVSAANLPFLGARQQTPRFALVESKHRGNADFEGIIPRLLPKFPKRIIHHFYLAALAAPLYSTIASPEKQRRRHMRNGKKPTRKQKIRLGQAGLAPENWLVIRQKPNGELVILHKHTDTVRVVPPLVG